MNILTKIKFNISFLIILLLGMVTGLYKEVLIFSSLILIHEAGHLVIGLIFRKEIEKVTIYMFGGYIKFKSKINTPFLEDFFIAIAGFISQTIYLLVILLLYKQGIVTEFYHTSFIKYYWGILIFNLVPIHPLDGYKLLKIILLRFFSFKLANKIGICISFIMVLVTLCLSFVYKMSFNYLLIFSLLIKEIYTEYQNQNLVFNKFLLERYLYDFSFKRRTVFKHNQVSKMFKDRKHLFKDKNGYKTEKQILNKRFDLKR